MVLCLLCIRKQKRLNQCLVLYHDNISILMICYWLMLAGLCNKPAVRIYVLVTFGNYSDGGQLKKNTGHKKVQFLHLVCCRN